MQPERKIDLRDRYYDVEHSMRDRAEQLVEHKKGRTITFGVLLTVLGILALLAPVATSLGVSLALGVALFVAGIIEFVHAWQSRHIKEGRWSRPFLALLSLVAGALVLRSPVAGAIAITLMISFYLFAAGAAQWSTAFELKPRQGWGWMLASSIVSFALALYLFVTFPATSLVIPGVFFGVDLLFYGASLIGLGVAAGRVSKLMHERDEYEKNERKAA